jgi:hypothetical protein
MDVSSCEASSCGTYQPLFYPKANKEIIQNLPHYQDLWIRCHIANHDSGTKKISKNGPPIQNIRTSTIRNKVARSAARYARAEAGSSALELMFSHGWMKKEPYSELFAHG